MTYPLTKDPNRKTSRWDTAQEIQLTGGINSDQRPDQLKPGQVVDILNLLNKKQDMQVDTGYKQLGTGADTETAFKRVREYQAADGSVKHIGITKGSVYIYNTTNMAWEYVKGTASTDLDGAFITADTALKVDSSAGFLAGERIGITLTNGQQYRTTIASVPDATHITIAAPGLPSAASDEGVVVRAVVLNGSDLYPVMAINVPSNNWLVFTNNVDYIMRYNGTDCVVVPGLVTTTAASVVLYNSAVFLLNTTEAAVNHPTRVRRCEIGDPTTWAGGTAGYDDLLDTEGGVVGGDVLGPYLVVYKQRSVYRGQFVNTGGKFYQFDAMLHGDTGEGLIATDGIINVGPYHVFVGNANVYQYYGDFVLTPIANQLFYLLFSADAPINPAQRPLTFGIFVEGLQEVWIFYCSSASATWPDSLFRYNIKTGAWTRRLFKDMFSSSAVAVLATPTALLLWSGIVGDWSDLTWVWNSSVVGASARPVILLTPTATKQVFEYDFISADDNGTAISGSLTTRDFVWEGGDFRTDRMDVFMQGLDVLIQYSSDEGQTWLLWNTESSANMGRVQSYQQVVVGRIRFRFTCSDPNFRLRWMTLTWRPESVQGAT